MKVLDEFDFFKEKIGEVELKAQSEGSTTIGEEETSVRVERALVFLDMWTVVESDGSINTKVFRKDTHTDQYLNRIYSKRI